MSLAGFLLAVVWYLLTAPFDSGWASSGKEEIDPPPPRVSSLQTSSSNRSISVNPGFRSLNEGLDLLVEKILATTGAEEDVPWNSYLYFEEHLAKVREDLCLDCGKACPTFEPSFSTVLDNLRLPLADWFESHQKKTIPLLLRETISESHESFESLRGFVKQIEAQRAAARNLEVASVLSDLVDYYQGVIAKLCAMQTEERSDYLTDRARMNLERTGKSYLISQAKARQLLNRPNVCE